MKKIIIIAFAAALVLSLGVVAYAAAANNQPSQPESSQGETIPAESPEVNGEKPSDRPELPEMNGDGPPVNTGTGKA